jgi:hypothetical protein
LPTNIASIGTAAAMISITLFDFSSISCERTMVESIRVRRKSPTWATCAVLARALASEPEEVVTFLTRMSVGIPAPGARALAINSRSWPSVVGSSEIAPISRGWSRPPASTARTGGLRLASSRCSCSVRSGSGS